MSLCRIITLKNDRSLGHEMSTTAKIEHMQKELILAGPFKWSQFSYDMAAIREREVLQNNFLLDHDVAISYSLTVVDDMEKKPLFLNKSASHALLLMGEMIEGIFDIIEVQNLRLNTIRTEPETSRLIIDFVIPRRLSAHFMVGASLCFRVALDSMLFIRGINACEPQIKINSDVLANNVNTIEILQQIMTKTL